MRSVTASESMNILIAEDEAVSRNILRSVLEAAGYRVTAAANGLEALDAWRIAESRVVISDWLMPELDGLDLCRRIREARQDRYTYYILLTGRSGKDSYLTAMDAGIDDFITKPVDADELKARLRVAERILGLRERIDALEGLLPICSYCKRIRDDKQTWNALEGYIEQRSGAEFSHGVCPDCYRKHLEPGLER
jgi:sigma-B regulation protein RsbU (phosphoserine phosphatase)